MKPNMILNGLQVDTHLKQYNIQTDINIIKFKQNYSLDNYIEELNTNIFYKDTEIIESDLLFKIDITEQEKQLILEALNKLRLKIY